MKVRNDGMALLLADQRMPRIDGVEFLQQATGDTLSRIAATAESLIKFGIVANGRP